MKNIQSRNIVNLTRHTIVLGKDGVKIPPSGNFARIVWSRIPGETMLVDNSSEMPIIKIGPQGNVLGLPEEQEGFTYVVSPELRIFLTLTGVDRTDVVSPFAISGKGDNRFAGALAL